MNLLDKSQLQKTYLQYLQQTNALDKHFFLNKLHNTNQSLFFKLVELHLEEMLPILYTPTIADAILNFDNNFRLHGLCISYKDRNHISEMLKNRDADLIVVTDGERILGLGDQGASGIKIPIAKLMLYSLFGNINPKKTLPIFLDAGTNNQKLLEDSEYSGWRHPRLRGEEYLDFIQSFVSAVKKTFPRVLLHWEDFGRDNAIYNLRQFREKICSINDDIQGAGVVTTAALLMALKKTNQKLIDQRIVIFGAGSAGTGIADLISFALIKEGLTEKEARKHFWLIDKQGLLTESSSSVNIAKKPYLRSESEVSQWRTQSEHLGLKEVVANVKPTVLIGCSTVSQAFTKDIIQDLAKHIENPIIFALSNPTTKCEAKPEDIMQWTLGKALMATGSPFPSVNFQDQTIEISQCNNALSFPGVGLGVIATKAKMVTDEMLWEAAKTLFKCSLDMADGTRLLPPFTKAKDIAKHIALAIAKKALSEKVTDLEENVDVEKLIQGIIWQPEMP